MLLHLSCKMIPASTLDNSVKFAFRLPFLSAFLLIYNHLFCYAQSPGQIRLPGYNIRHFSDENGLPQNSVKSIMRDERRNIWLATERGLVRFDGRRFIKFDDFGNSYSSKNINGFFLHPQNRKPGVLAPTQIGNWVRILEGSAAIDSSFKGFPKYEPLDPSGTFRNQLFEILPAPNEDSFVDRISEFSPIFTCPNGRHFAYHKGNVEFYIENKFIKRIPFPKANVFHFFRQGKDLYYLDARLNLSRFASDVETRAVERLEIHGDIAPLLGEKQLGHYQIFWNNASGQAFIQIEKKLFFLQQSKSGTFRSKLVIDGFDFDANTIRSIYFEHDNERVFLGSMLNGLYIIEKKPFTAVVFPDAADNIYYGQTLADGNSILTTEGNRFSIDGYTGKLVTRKLELVGRTTGWDQYSVLKDKKGNIWSKRGDFLFLFDSTGKQLKSDWKLHEVTQLYEGLNGRIWIGTTMRGLHYIEPGAPDAKPVRYPIKTLMNISWIQHQSPSLLWVGTGAGLYKLDLNTNKIVSIKGLENIYIRSLYIPKDQEEVWISTYTSGYFLFKKGKLTKLPLDNHQYLANAHCIFEDKNGFLWIPTNKGLFQMKKSDLLAYVKSPFQLYYHYYPKSAGFNTNEFNGGCQPCAVRMNNGMVSLPSINGLVWFTPEKIKPEQPNKPIFIDNLQIDGQTSVTSQREIHIPAGASEISLTVSTPYFGEADNLHLSYTIFKGNRSLVGWKDLDENMRISIPFLQGGRYTLSIRKLNGFGPRNHANRNVVIIVEKAWFETWWFYLILILLVSTMIFLSVQFRLKRVEKRNQMLEMQISDRTQQLQGTMKDLEESQSEVQRQLHLQSRLMASIGHDVRTPLRAAIIVAKELRNLIQHQKLEEAMEYGTHIEDAMVRVKDSLESLLAYVKIQVFRRDVHKDKVNLHLLIQKNFHLYGETTLSEPNSFVNQVPEDLFVQTSHQLLDVIVHNLVDNSNKFTSNGTIKASVALENGRLSLTIEDTGSGLPKKLMEWMNGQEPTAPTEYNGVGLVIIKELLPYVADRFEMHNLNPGTASILYFSEFWLPQERHDFKISAAV